MKASGFVERPAPKPSVQAKPAAAPQAGSVVQRKLFWDDTNKVYDTNADRPDWRAPSEKIWTQEFNKQHGSTYKQLPYQKLDMARGHEMSFDQLQKNIANYLNHPGPAGEGTFRKLVATLIAQAPSKEQKEVNKALEELVDAVQTRSNDEVVDSANELLRLLNSLSPNVRPVDTYVNSYVGENLDPHFEEGPNGMSLNQHGKNLLDLGASVVGNPLLSPGGTSIISSSEGRVNFGNMSPDTHKRFTSFPTDQKKIGSDNVKKALYSGALANTRALTQTTTTSATQPVSNSNSNSNTSTQPTSSMQTASQGTSFYQPMQPVTLSPQQQLLIHYQQLWAYYQQLGATVNWYWQNQMYAPDPLFQQYRQVEGDLLTLQAILWPSQ